MRSPLRGELQPVALREPLDVPPVEELHAHVGIEALNLAKLAVLARHERLLHDRDLDEEVLLREVEVGREGTDDASVLVPLEDEGVRLVVPRNAVVVEDLGALDLDPVGEPWRLVATICLENGTCDPHLRHRTDGPGRPPNAP